MLYSSNFRKSLSMCTTNVADVEENLDDDFNSPCDAPASISKSLKTSLDLLFQKNETTQRI